MNNDVLSERIEPSARPLAGENHDDYRTRIAVLRAEALKRREQERSEQCSPLNSAADRIRIWERRHQLPLPRNPTHVLLADIAAGTGLTLEDVQAEQRLRAESRAAAGKA